MPPKSGDRRPQPAKLMAIFAEHRMNSSRVMRTLNQAFVTFRRKLSRVAPIIPPFLRLACEYDRPLTPKMKQALGVLFPSISLIR
jgi:hypothetical protein